MNGNLFKSPIDGIGYWMLYFCVPVAQCISYLIIDPSLFWFSVLLMVASLFYDCYTRYNSNDSKSKRSKIICVGVISFLLLVFSLFILIVRSNGIVISPSCRYVYLLLVIPFSIATIDVVNRIAKSLN